MTLLQLKYIVTIAAAGTISEAAKQLYIAQPSLTASVKELEKELGITIFQRTNKGVLLSAEGEEFLGYSRPGAVSGADDHALCAGEHPEILYEHRRTGA